MSEDQFLLRDKNGKALGEGDIPDNAIFIFEVEENVVKEYFRKLREQKEREQK